MSLFGNTVDKITASLGYMVTQLEAHAKAMNDKFDRHTARARAEEAKARDALVEVDRAHNVAKKIGELLN